VMLSDGSPTRTFCYVADAVCGYYAALARGGRGESYNIGVEEPEISMADLAERIAAIGRELFGYTGKVVRQASDEADYLIDNPNRRAPRIKKARNELDYEPAMTLDDGLRRSLIWYADNREADGG
jgi:UDP-glucuronate decarboxylase